MSCYNCKTNNKNKTLTLILPTGKSDTICLCEDCRIENVLLCQWCSKQFLSPHGDIFEYCPNCANLDKSGHACYCCDKPATTKVVSYSSCYHKEPNETSYCKDCYDETLHDYHGYKICDTCGNLIDWSYGYVPNFQTNESYTCLACSERE